MDSGPTAVGLLLNLHFVPIFGAECRRDNRAYFRHYLDSLLANMDVPNLDGLNLKKNKMLLWNDRGTEQRAGLTESVSNRWSLVGPLSMFLHVFLEISFLRVALSAVLTNMRF